MDDPAKAVATLTIDELAQATATSTDTLRAWQDLGLLSSRGDTLRDEDIERVRLLEFVRQRGIPPEAVARACETQGDLLGDFVDSMLGGPLPRARRVPHRRCAGDRSRTGTARAALGRRRARRPAPRRRRRPRGAARVANGARRWLARGRPRPDRARVRRRARTGGRRRIPAVPPLRPRAPPGAGARRPRAPRRDARRQRPAQAADRALAALLPPHRLPAGPARGPDAPPGRGHHVPDGRAR